jgi:two-component system, LuxR family, sensor kinase FixL
MRGPIGVSQLTAWEPWRAGVLLLAAYLGVAGATLWFVHALVDPSLAVEVLAVPWLAEGVAVAGLLIAGTRIWPALLVGSVIVWGGFRHGAAITVGIDAIAEAASIVLIVRLLSAWRFHRRFDRFSDPLVLLLAAVVGRVAANAIDDVGLWLCAVLAPDSLAPLHRAEITGPDGAFPVLTMRLFWEALSWTLNSVAGIVLVVPALVASPREFLVAARRHPLALVLLGVLCAGWSAVALGIPLAAARLPLLIVALMLVTWAAAGFGVTAATGVTLLLSLVATVAFGLRLGPLGSTGPAESIEVLWGFIGLLAVTGLFLTALLAERRHDVARLAARAQRYQRLFKANPSPVWVAEPGDGRILMANEAATRLYGYDEAEFSRMTVAELAASPGEGTTTTAAARAVQHRTRDGRVVDVELLLTSLELDGRPVSLCYAIDVTARNDLRARLIAAADLERRRLAQELHDGLGQVLTGLSLGAQGAAVKVARGGALEASVVEFLSRTSTEAARLCRALVRGVSPLEDTHGDLLEALRRLPASLPPGPREQLEIAVDGEAALMLSRERSEHVYRVVQEAVNNAIKHAKARHLRVHIVLAPEQVEVSVEDDGVGVDSPPRPGSGLGMRSMTMRATAAGAKLEVEPRRGGGTVIRCVCPTVESPPRAPPRPAAAESASPPAPRGARANPWGDAGRTAFLALACFMGLAVTTLIARRVDPAQGLTSPNLATPSLLAGLSVAGLAIFGARLWPGVLVGAFAASVILSHDSAGVSFVYGLDHALTALVLVWLLGRSGFRRSFDRWQDPVILLLVTAAVEVADGGIAALRYLGFAYLSPASLKPSLRALMTDAAGAFPVAAPAFLATLARWTANRIAGVVMLVPFIAALPQLARAVRGRAMEAGAWCAALALWTTALFLFATPGARWPLLTAALILLIWSVVRFGVALAAGGIFACAIAATLSFALQRGTFATGNRAEGPLALWGFLALLVVTGMFVTALLAERNRSRDSIVAAGERYRRLFAHDPHPLFVLDRASGRILMVNEAAIRHYGYAQPEFLAMSCDDLVVGTGPRTPAGGMAELRHRVKDGSVIEVAVTNVAIDLDQHPALLSFAVDVSERNALRRGFIESTDRERRRLAGELSAGLGRALEALESAAASLQASSDAGHVERAAVERVAEASRAAAVICRQTAHSVSPLQANNGDLLAAVQRLPEAVRSAVEVRVHAGASVNLPLAKREQLYELIREAVAELVATGRAQSIVVSLDVEPELIRVEIENNESGEPGLGRARAIAVRAAAMGAILKQRARAQGGWCIVCECPQPLVAA